jgi:hypothetical protein
VIRGRSECKESSKSRCRSSNRSKVVAVAVEVIVRIIRVAQVVETAILVENAKGVRVAGIDS